MNRRNFIGAAVSIPLLPAAATAEAVLEPRYNWIRYQWLRINPAIVVADYAQAAGMPVDWPSVRLAAQFCDEPIEFLCRATSSDGRVAESRLMVTVRREP